MTDWAYRSSCIHSTPLWTRQLLKPKRRRNGELALSTTGWQYHQFIMDVVCRTWRSPGFPQGRGLHRVFILWHIVPKVINFIPLASSLTSLSVMWTSSTHAWFANGGYEFCASSNKLIISKRQCCVSYATVNFVGVVFLIHSVFCKCDFAVS